MSDRCSNIECGNFQSQSIVITDIFSGKKYHTFVCSDCGKELDKAYGVEDIPFEENLKEIFKRES